MAVFSGFSDFVRGFVRFFVRLFVLSRRAERFEHSLNRVGEVAKESLLLNLGFYAKVAEGRPGTSVGMPLTLTISYQSAPFAPRRGSNLTSPFRTPNLSLVDRIDFGVGRRAGLRDG